MLTRGQYTAKLDFRQYKASAGMITDGQKVSVVAAPNSGFGNAAGRLYKFFEAYLKHWGMVMTCIAVVLMACSLKGDLVFVAVLTYKTYSENVSPFKQTSSETKINATAAATTTSPHSDSLLTGQENVSSSSYEAILPDYLQLPAEYNLKDLLLYWFIGVASSQLMYQAMCSFFQFYYYTLQRRSPEKWKCQPHRFLTRSNEIHEIVVGTVNMTFSGSISGFCTCWIMNGNYNKLYFRLDEYGYPYLLFSMVALFLWIEAWAYYTHTMIHMPWLYKHIHKHHHRYHSPTAYSVIAMSPFELAMDTSYVMAPMFLFPINALAYVTVVVYVYYYGVIDHSGIKMDALFPWQPDSMFHDDHHRYFHCNFGFNSYLFDWLHGTLRRTDRLYREDIFWGRGKKME